MARWTARVLLALTVSATARAQPVPDAALSWVRVKGAESCIGSQELALRVEEKVGHPVWVSTSDADVSVEGYVRPGPEERFTAILVTSGRNGAIVGRRELTSDSPDCRTLDEPVALVISLTIDPESGFVDLPDSLRADADDAAVLLDQAPPPLREDMTGAEPPQPAVASPDDPVEPDASPGDPLPPPMATRRRGGLVSALVGGGQLPGATVGAALAWIGSKRQWPFGLEARLWLPRERDQSDNAS